MNSNVDLLQMVHEIGDAVLADEMNLSDWESRFIEDMAPKLRLARFVPSVNQEAVILRMWNKSRGKV